MLFYIIDPLFIYLSQLVGIGISRAPTGLLSTLFLYFILSLLLSQKLPKITFSIHSYWIYTDSVSSIGI